MAGVAKPNVENLGAEAQLNIISSLGRGSVNGLFDGIQINEWDSVRVFYWNNSKTYVEFSVSEKVNIWRSGTGDWSGYTNKFIIYRYVDGAYVDITSSITQTTSAITHTQWEKTIHELPPGRYKFSYGTGLRLDSEWYVESVSRFLIKKDGQYYSINSEFYDTELQQYTSLSTADFTKAFPLDDLFKEIIINESTTITPINEFNNFQLVTVKVEENFILRGVKTTRELIVANDDIPLSIAQNIDFFKLTANLQNNGIVKLALSIDKGVTWKTFNGAEFLDLNCTIPLKNYTELTEEELVLWNTAKDEILNNGIILELFHSIDFNLIDSDTVRFAYVLDKPEPQDTAETTQLEWKFDALGSFQKMKDTEYSVNAYQKQIKITSLIDNSIIKVNLIV